MLRHPCIHQYQDKSNEQGHGPSMGVCIQDKTGSLHQIVWKVAVSWLDDTSGQYHLGCVYPVNLNRTQDN